MPFTDEELHAARDAWLRAKSAVPGGLPLERARDYLAASIRYWRVAEKHTRHRGDKDGELAAIQARIEAEDAFREIAGRSCHTELDVAKEGA